jgi:hypothetical protein
MWLFELPPGESVELPVQEGYCLNIYKPPVPAGEPFQPLSSWLSTNVEHPVDTTTILSLKPIRPEILSQPDNLYLTYPGTRVELPDVFEDLASAAPLFIGVVQKTREAYDLLKKEGRIDTPFSETPQRERESVIQQVLWVYTSRLDKEPYEQADLQERIESQYLETSGPTKEILQEGGIRFWDSFMLVGTEAKVFSQDRPRE